MALKTLDLVYQTVFAELDQRCAQDAFQSDFPIEGSFVRTTVKGRDYWYYKPSVKNADAKRKYVGPASDPDLATFITEFQRHKIDYQARRKLVSTLTREARLDSPDPVTGEVVKALTEAGFFRLRGVLVGTVAFQTYAAMLGVRLPVALMQTGDADFAQFHSISEAVDDSLPPMLDLLRTVDKSFREIPDSHDGRSVTQYETATRYRVEFLTPNTGSEDHQGKPAPMPALGGASAQTLRFLDFLIHLPVRTALLYGGGVSVRVPAPERYAVHKLIVATRRRDDGQSRLKLDKDIAQAGQLMQALIETRHHADLAGALEEAWARGPHWREALQTGWSYLDPDVLEVMKAGLLEGFKVIGSDLGRHAPFAR